MGLDTSLPWTSRAKGTRTLVAQRGHPDGCRVLAVEAAKGSPLPAPGPHGQEGRCHTTAIL